MSEEIDKHVMRKYEVAQKLGKGAYGIVWKATDKKSKETVALEADTCIPGPPCCTYGLCVPASCLLYVPEAQGSLPRWVDPTHCTFASLGRAVRRRGWWW